MTIRTYTGITDGVAPGRRPGTERFAASVEFLTGGRLWNNGTFGIRQRTSGTGLSVHATGRAVDLSARPTTNPARPGGDLQYVRYMADEFARHADTFGIEMVIHYAAEPGGRIWRCDRAAWRAMTPGTLTGGGQPWADWLHVELAPTFADRPELIDDAWGVVLTGNSAPSTNPPPPPLAPLRYPGRPLQIGSTGKAVAAVQRRLGILADGKFGPVTDRHVREYQRRHGLTVDGIVGPITWASLAPTG